MTVERLGEVVDGEIVRTSSEWAEVIKGDLGRAVEGIVAAGRNLIAAKADVAHGEWLPMLEEIGISEAEASRLRSIAVAASNLPSLEGLPKSVSALYELSRMDPDDIEAGVESGAISPKTTIKEARELATAGQGPSKSADDDKEPAIVVLINDLRGPWRKGITRAAKTMTPKARAYVIEALEGALNDIKEMQS